MAVGVFNGKEEKSIRKFISKITGKMNFIFLEGHIYTARDFVQSLEQDLNLGHFKCELFSVELAHDIRAGNV